MVTNFQSGVASFGSVIHAVSPTMGKEYHVKKEADANYGRWYDDIGMQHYDSSFNIQPSVEAAIDVADDFDTIWVYPGSWRPAATLAITQTNLRLLAAFSGPWGALSGTEIRAMTAMDIISANGAHNLEIAGFWLRMYDSQSHAAIRLADSAAQYRTWIHDNNFYAIAPGSGLSVVCGILGSYATDTTYITRNTFWKGGQKMITLGQGMREVIQGNLFTQVGGIDSYCIYAADLGAGVRNSFILDNRFFNAESSAATCVHMGSTITDYGEIQIDNNHFTGYADSAHCIDDTFEITSAGANFLNGALITS